MVPVFAGKRKLLPVFYITTALHFFPVPKGDANGILVWWSPNGYRPAITPVKKRLDQGDAAAVVAAAAGKGETAVAGVV